MARGGGAASLQMGLDAQGLVLLGGFEPDPGEVLPALSGGAAPKALALVASAGPAMWRQVRQSDEFQSDPNPIDSWSKRVLAGIAEEHGAEVAFPFEGPPYWPFQRWVMRLPAMSQSPLGVVVHSRYGPWFALRGALLFAEARDFAAADEGPGPCPGCAEKPCLDACPAGALTRTSAFDARLCRDYVRANQNRDCAERGCLVRHACPYGRDYAYEPGQARHHMAAFAR